MYGCVFLKVPVLILGNKIDLTHAISEDDLRHHLGLQYTSGKQKKADPSSGRPIEVFMCSVVSIVSIQNSKPRQGNRDGL